MSMNNWQFKRETKYCGSTMKRDNTTYYAGQKFITPSGIFQIDSFELGGAVGRYLTGMYKDHGDGIYKSFIELEDYEISESTTYTDTEGNVKTFLDYPAIPLAKVKGQGAKLDSGKPDYYLIPPKALEEVVKALTFGAKEHDSDDLSKEPNWKSVPHLERRFFAAAQRHQWKYRGGEKYDTGDKGSNCHHLACAITNLLFVLEKELEKVESEKQRKASEAALQRRQFPG